MSVQQKISIGVIGAGNNTQRNHLPVLKRLSDEGHLVLTALCDINATQAKEVAGQFGFLTHGHDARQLIARTDIDAVYVFGTVAMHTQYMQDALAAGKHVFVEKPPAHSWRDLLPAHELAKKSDRIVAVGFNRRFYASINRARDIYAHTQALVSVDALYHKPLLNRAHLHGAHSAIHFSSIHAIDAVVYAVAGDALTRDALPAELYAQVNRVEGDTPQNMSALIGWNNGVHATLASNNTAGSRTEIYTMHIPGISYTADETTLTITSEKGTETPVLNEDIHTLRGFYGEHKAFIEAIVNKTVPRHSIAHALTVLYLMELLEQGHHGPIDWSPVLTPSSDSSSLQHKQTPPSLKHEASEGSILVLNPHALADTLPKLREYHTLVFEEDLSALSQKERSNIVAIVMGKGDQHISEKLLSLLPSIRVVGMVGASLKKFYPELVIARGIPIVNASSVYARAVAEFNLLQALVGLKNASRSHDVMRSGGWGVSRPAAFSALVAHLRSIAQHSAAKPIHPLLKMLWQRFRPHIKATEEKKVKGRGGALLRGKTIGIIGFGEITREVIHLFQQFACTIHVHSQYLSEEEAKQLGVARASLAETLRSNVVMLQRGLSERTRHSFGHREMALLRPGTVFINTSRGALIDEAALIERLKKNDIFACLDVFEEEPLPKNSPLRTLPNVFLTAHLSGPAHETFSFARVVVVEKVIDYLAGRPVRTIHTKEHLANMT